MKKKTVMVIGIIGILMVLGAAVALAQNSSSEKTMHKEDHECTPEMMEDMSKNCPEEMMQSGECEKMMDGAKDCSGMMAGSGPDNKKAGEGEHCGDMGSGMLSMMGSKDADKKGMM